MGYDLLARSTVSSGATGRSTHDRPVRTNQQKRFAVWVAVHGVFAAANQLAMIIARVAVFGYPGDVDLQPQSIWIDSRIPVSAAQDALDSFGALGASHYNTAGRSAELELFQIRPRCQDAEPAWR